MRKNSIKKYFVFFVFIFAVSCSTIQQKPPENFTYIQIQTNDYVLASMQKITDKKLPIRIYIEGDGNAYTSKGYPTDDPTPKSNFLRNMAFDDPNPNVVYLARPCQFIKNKNYDKKDWTTGRFSQKIVDNVAQAIKQISADNKTILIGYSGAALLTGLIINQYEQELNVVKWITIAGLLNHTEWTNYFHYVPLKDSLDLDIIPNISQTHYVAKKDSVIPYKLTVHALGNKNYILIQNATHNKAITIDYNDN